jgi:ATP-dependent DNA helicase
MSATNMELPITPTKRRSNINSEPIIENEILSPYSKSILDAQKEADKVAEELENNNELINETNNITNSNTDVVVPKLLKVDPTAELKAKGSQLDLLLLKAESYSNFILQNQKITKMNQDKRDQELKKKRKGSKDNSSSTNNNKKSKSNSEEMNKAQEINIKSSIIMDSTEEITTSSFKQPPNLTGGKLMGYQLEGLRWLLSLWENGLSGILADEMGLGKTIQIISLIAHLRSVNTPGPFIIAGPLATLMNWINEFKKWLPSCPVILYHGNKAEREQIRRKMLKINNQKSLDFPVVITSFEIMLIDRPFLEKYTWQYMILDEGHRIKNRNCKLVRELKHIKSVSRLLLTGTPIQNTLEELWSLLNFCSPAIFDNLEVFQAWFGFKNIGKDTQVDEIIDNEHHSRVITKLHEILRPFLLRRIKRGVLLKMPPKKEIVVYCGMSSLQSEYYTLIKQGKIREALISMGIEGAKDVSQQNMIMNLRKVCNHPFLFGEPCDDRGRYLGEAQPKLLSMASGKFRLLDRMLPLLKKQGHKVLIFSQMTELLNILEDYLLLTEGYDYCRLDGSTKIQDRQAGIDRFNKDPNCFVFLLSTRAGGLGINLTSADTCILFDSDWNPHADSQAMDRCHRIGQDNPVIVYRFLTAGSIEIEMMAKQISKKKLERLTIHGGDFNMKRAPGKTLTLTRLRQLLTDDVKNLNRMIRNDDEDLEDDIQRDDNNDNSAQSKHFTKFDINESEFSFIMNRDQIFSNDGSNIPEEGSMYDVINVETSGVLQGIN